VSTASEQNGLGHKAEVALAKVKLEYFTAEPLTIEPFTRSKISWKVTVPKEIDASVDLDIDNTFVATSGEFSVAPEATTSYRLRAQVADHSKILGTVTVQVGLEACVAGQYGPVPGITSEIGSHIGSSNYFRSDPVVTIQDDLMVIRLRLKHEVNGFPDPSIDIDASFGLDVIPVPPSGSRRFLAITPFDHVFHQLAPANMSIKVDASFPWYVWLIPGAMLILPIILSDIEGKAYAVATDMINEIVDLLNGLSDFLWPDLRPPKMDKHDASFYVNPQGNQLFWVNFCPVPRIVSSPVD
jgi:hypothetical protein